MQCTGTAFLKLYRKNKVVLEKYRSFLRNLKNYLRMSLRIPAYNNHRKDKEAYCYGQDQYYHPMF